MSDGPIKLAGENHGEERREEYAKMLEAVAEEVREGGSVPEAIYIMSGWDNGRIGKAIKCEAGYSAFQLIGVLDCLKADLVRDVIDEGF